MPELSPANVLAAVSLVVFAGMAWAALEMSLGQRSIQRLEEVDPEFEPFETCPSVSIVIPARNEERKLRDGLESVLALDYPELEIIVVDDRSEDATPAILAEIAATDRRVTAIHVRELPDGWLGKNHALEAGAGKASGEWLLFADADVVMSPSVLRRAVRCSVRRGLDHLAVAPRVTAPGTALKIVVNVFMVYFNLFFRPWKASDSKSGAYVGIGAFNLVRADAYRACGGHSPIRMRPDDDVRLGRLLKRRGFRQLAATGATLIRVEWYASLSELLEGLMKNMFAGFDYRLWMVVGATIGQALCFLWPYAGLFLTGGAPRWANLGTVLAMLWLYTAAARFSGTPAWHGLAFRGGVLILLFVLWKSTVRTLRAGGIQWRGTFYPLSRLKEKTD